jgi:hypothetical protein
MATGNIEKHSQTGYTARITKLSVGDLRGLGASDLVLIVL